MDVKGLARRHLRRTGRFPWIGLRSARPLTVRMDTTNRCNLRCSMCPMRLSDRDPDRVWLDMDPALFGRIASQVFPRAGSVALSCGAEPLCNPSFPDYLRILHRSGVPGREMVTNGLLLDAKVSEAILSHPPTAIFVSVDGAEPATQAAIRGGCDLDLVVGNIRSLVRGRDASGARLPRVLFSSTIQRRNLSELPGMVALAAECGADGVNASVLVPYEGLDVMPEVPDTSSADYASSIAAARDEARRLGVLFNLLGNADRPKDAICRYVRSWVFIAPDGLVFPCPYWNLGSPMGDLSREDFGRIWNGRAYRQLRESLSGGSPAGFCTDCPEYGRVGAVELRKTDF